MGKKSCLNNVLEQPILTRISDIDPTDNELKDNICIKNQNKRKINISGILSDH